MAEKRGGVCEYTLIDRAQRDEVVDKVNCKYLIPRELRYRRGSCSYLCRELQLRIWDPIHVCVRQHCVCYHNRAIDRDGE